MPLKEIKDRVKVRKPEAKEGEIEEYATTAIDRINLRLGLTLLPVELESVAVEIICALYNRKRFSGIKNEQVDTFSVSFVDDVLKEYEEDFRLYLERKAKQDNEHRGVVRFL